ncbi:MAG: hypothetical protein OEZ13_10755 [Spirochaetia bacterium]|nr:hypothetical protein [Spirochaetia bacterium]
MKKKITKTGALGLLAVSFFFFAASKTTAQEIDEEELFSDEKTVTNIEEVKDEKINKSLEEESLTFGGFINSRNSYMMNRSYVLGDTDSVNKNTLRTFIQSDYYLDARLRSYYKAFVNFSINVYPQGIEKRHTFNNNSEAFALLTGSSSLEVYETVYSDYEINEAFVDANIQKSVYLRIGKQNLKWGTGYFWNPVDLINIDKKSFTDEFQIRRGAYGLKVHIPFGTRFNIYNFTGINEAKSLDKLSNALKVDFLLGSTEMALSVLGIKNKPPVYGYELSSRIFTVDIYGETSLVYKETNKKIKIINYMPVVEEIENKWALKTVIGFGRSFELFDLADRLSLNFEFFYNQNGYRENIFQALKPEDFLMIEPDLIAPNYHGMYYMAFFSTIRQFFHQDLNFSMNYMMNISDKTSILSTHLSYLPVYNFSLGLILQGFLGNKGEYTFSQNGLNTEISAKIVF